MVTTFLTWPLWWQVIVALYILLTLLFAGAAIWDALDLDTPKQLRLPNHSRRRRLKEATFLLFLIVTAWPPILVLMLVEQRWPGTLPRRFSQWLFTGAGTNSSDSSIEVLARHLGDAVDIQDIETSARVSDPLRAVPDVPFGHLYPRWLRVREHMSSNRHLRPFSVPRRGDLWGRKVNHVGWAVVTDEGQVVHYWVADIVTEGVTIDDTSKTGRRETS